METVHSLLNGESENKKKVEWRWENMEIGEIREIELQL